MTGAPAMETRLQGVPLSEGCTIARVCMFNERRHSNLPIYRVKKSEAGNEEQRAEAAMRLAAQELERIRDRVEQRVGKAEAGIFAVQAMILEDEQVRSSILALIRDSHLNAETAVARALDDYETRLLEVDSSYIKERATDIGEIRRRVLDVLANMQPSLQCGDGHCQKGRNRVIVAEELTPSLTVDMDTDHVMGFVTERGGPLSHAAILARGLGIPAVSGLDGIRDRVACGVEILVNGNTGEVVLWPQEATVREAVESGQARVRLPQPVEPVPELRVLANIGLASEAQAAREARAEGIGLYRTEVELMAAGRALTEDELLERFRTVGALFPDLPVVFRLPDAGADKPLPFLRMPREDNPALGCRGARLLLGEPALLRPTARALARLSREREVHVLYPMIVDLAHFQRLRGAFDEATTDSSAGRLLHGVMFEVPSLCLQAEEVLRVADFASVGTNDLIQYLFAVDRNNARVAGDFDPSHPVLWNLLRTLVETARRLRRPLSVCGELAGDPVHVPRLLELGIESVSVAARRIAPLRAAVRRAVDA